jgi:hypothetical protein
MHNLKMGAAGIAKWLAERLSPERVDDIARGAKATSYEALVQQAANKRHALNIMRRRLSTLETELEEMLDEITRIEERERDEIELEAMALDERSGSGEYGGAARAYHADALLEELNGR